MPNLPTLSVTDPQATRLLAAFSNQTAPDGTPLTPQQACRRWLKTALVNHVKNVEATALDAQHTQAVINLRAEADAALDLSTA